MTPTRPAKPIDVRENIKGCVAICNKMLYCLFNNTCTKHTLKKIVFDPKYIFIIIWYE